MNTQTLKQAPTNQSTNELDVLRVETGQNSIQD